MQEGSLFNKRFKIIRSLGSGSGGHTYLAEDHLKTKGWVALKLLNLQEASPVIVQAFEQEGALLKKLSHPNVVRLLDYGQAENHLYICSEFIEGENLVSAAKKRDWNAVFSLIVQAAWALQYLHDHHIFHRDIKPDNLLVGQIYQEDHSPTGFRNTLKIIDLGLAAPPSDGQKRSQIVGSLAYMAPEVLAGEGADHRADLYSFGIVLYELALGKHPIKEEGLFSIYLEKLKKHEIDLTPLFQWETPNGMIEIIQKLVEKDPQKRLARSDGMIDILNRVEHENFSLTAPRPDAKRREEIIAEAPRKNLLFDATLSHALALKKLRELARSGHREEALHWAQPYLKEIHTWNDPSIIEDFFASVIHVLIEQGKFDEAERLLQKMKIESKRFGGFFLEYPLLSGNLEFRRGNLQKAEQIFRDISASNLQKSPYDKQARLENYWGLLSQAKKDWEIAATHYEKAAELSSRAGRKDHEASLLGNAASLYLEQGAWQKSFDLFQEALKIAREIDQRSLIATLTNNLGNLFLYFGRWSDAGTALQESLEICRDEGLHFLLALNLNLLIVAEEGSGHLERVQKYIKESLLFCEQLGDAIPMLQARLEQAHFFVQQKRYQEALQLSHEIQDKAQQLGQRHFIIQASWLMAKIELARGNITPGLSQAFELARRDALATGARMSVWQILTDEAYLALAQNQKGLAKKKFLEALHKLEELESEIPEQYRSSFWRDRKKENIRKGLENCEERNELVASLKSSNDIEWELSENLSPSPTDEVNMEMNPPHQTHLSESLKAPPLSFQKWAEVNRRLLLQQQIEPLLEEILDATIRLTDAERGFVIYSETQAFEVKASRNFQRENLKSEEEQFSYTIAQEVMRKGESMIVLDAQADQRFSAAASVHALSIRSVLCVPLRAGARILGLVYLDNRFRQGAFQKEFLPLIQTLADQASLILEHARLHRENQEKIEELKRSKDLIEKLNARLERDLNDTTASLEAVREGFKRQNEEVALRFTYDKIIGRSKKMREVLKTLDRLVDSNMNVYVFGESGTGKELIAQAIHFNSPRKDKPFIAENCTALPENLLESELFGHVRGAFTGAEKDKMGLFEVAHGGTIFLDEVGDMSLAMQAKLLRVLQEGEVRRVGGKDYRKVDVRIVSASNKDLKELVHQEKFRQDLYYRINVARLNLPPLRDRKEDLPLLTDHFLKEQASAMGQAKPKIAKEAIKILMNYDWPGNIRELQNEISRLLAFGGDITPENISPHIFESLLQPPPLSSKTGLDSMIAALEKKAIAEAMERTRGNKVKAAKLLKIGRRTLYAKLHLYQLQ